MRVKDIKIGETYNGVKVIEDAGCCSPNSSAHYFKCICPRCGGSFLLRSSRVGETKRCLSCQQEDLVGHKFGRLNVLKLASVVNGHKYWQCMCECGNVVNVQGGNLKSGGVKSCGCLRHNNPQRIKAVRKGIREKICRAVSVDFQFDNALSNHPLFNRWKSMFERCNNPKNSFYHRYGAKGIRVCDKWSGKNGFENFVNDMGEPPTPHHSIDRIDGNGNYEPSNCRWATQKEQMNNICRNSVVVVRGKRMTVTEFCEMAGLSRSAIYKPLCEGVDINFIVINSNKYRKGRRQYKTGHINHNRVVSEEVMKMLEERINV